MRNQGIFERNEKEANRFAAVVMLVTISFIVLVFILNLLNIFIVPLGVMSAALSTAALLLLIPAILIFVLKLDNWIIKYVVVSSASLMVATLAMFLSYHVVLLAVYPIAISSLYFSRRLSWYSVLFSIAVITCGQILGFGMDGVVDRNSENLSDLLIFGIIPRNIELLALALIFILLSKRTRNLLGSMVGAEEQKRMLDRMVMVTDKSLEVSNVLVESVKQLSEITEHTTEANEQIAGNTGRIVGGSENTLKLVVDAAEAVENISESIKQVADDGKIINSLSRQVSGLTEESGIIIKDAAEMIREIRDINRSSMEELQEIAAASEQQLASMQQVSFSVGVIEKISSELLEVVNKS